MSEEPRTIVFFAWIGSCQMPMRVINALNLDISHTYRTSQGREVCIGGYYTVEVSDE